MERSAKSLAAFCLAAFLAGASGCQPDEVPESSFSYETWDSAGVQIAENFGIPAAEASWSVAARPSVRIGGDSGGSAAMFTMAAQATRLGDGRIVVLEYTESELRFFDANGVHLRTVEGRGNGPREFEGAPTFVRLPGDTLLVVALGRQVFFDPGGDYIRDERIDARRHLSGNIEPCRMVTILSDGSFVGCEVFPTGDSTGRYASRVGRVIRFPSDDAPVPLGVYSEDYWGFFQPFTWIASGGSPPVVAIANNLAYSIEVWHPDGHLSRIIRRPDGLRAPTSTEISAGAEHLERAYGLSFRDRQPPELVPPAFGLTVGAAGDVWIRREPFVPDYEESVFDIFDRDGRFRGEVRFEGYFWLYEVGDDYVLGMRLDELDVPYVQLHRLDRGPS